MRFAKNQRLIEDDGRIYDKPIGDVILDAQHPTDEEVIDAIDTALAALLYRGASYRQVARALGKRHEMQAYRRCREIQPHIKARVRAHYHLD